MAKVPEAANQEAARDLSLEGRYSIIVIKKMEGVLYGFDQTKAQAGDSGATAAL